MNSCRFHDKKIDWRIAINFIISNVCLSENCTNTSVCTNMVEFVILKPFNAKIHPPKTSRIKAILWHPPLISWIKCNSDGAAHGSSDNAACSGAFKAFFALHAELMGAILVIEIAFDKD
jgi:hypothetical protein